MILLNFFVKNDCKPFDKPIIGRLIRPLLTAEEANPPFRPILYMRLILVCLEFLKFPYQSYL